MPANLIMATIEISSVQMKSPTLYNYLWPVDQTMICYQSQKAFKLQIYNQSSHLIVLKLCLMSNEHDCHLMYWFEKENPGDKFWLSGGIETGFVSYFLVLVVWLP